MKLKCRIRQIGTSKGIIIPYQLLKYNNLDIDDYVEVEINPSKSKSEVRKGWKEAFEKYAREITDSDIIEDEINSVSYSVDYWRGNDRKFKVIVIPKTELEKIEDVFKYIQVFLMDKEGTSKIVIKSMKLNKFNFKNDNE